MEHGHVSYDKTAPNSKALIIFLLLFVLSLGITIVGVFYLTKTTRDSTSISALDNLGIPYEVQKLRDYENQMLKEYGVVNSEKGVYRIPIDMAMDKVIRDYQ